MKLFLSLLAFCALLIFGGVTLDSAQIVTQAGSRVSEISTELQKLRGRFLDDLPPSVHSGAIGLLVDKYQKASTEEERENLFRQIVAAVRELPQLSEDSPLNRRLQDELAGALNRIAHLQRDADLARASYNKLRGSWRGRLAGLVTRA